jgi:hypothetical protein
MLAALSTEPFGQAFAAANACTTNDEAADLFGSALPSSPLNSFRN